MSLAHDLNAKHKERRGRLYPASQSAEAGMLIGLRAEMAEFVKKLTAARERIASLEAQLAEAKATGRPWKFIAAEVCRRHHVKMTEMASRRRTAAVVRARHELFYRLATETPMSSVEIGRVVGGFDHTSVIFGVRRHAILRGAHNPFPFAERMPKKFA